MGGPAAGGFDMMGLGGGGASFAPPVIEPPIDIPPVQPPQPQVQDIALADMLQRSKEFEAIQPPPPPMEMKAQPSDARLNAYLKGKADPETIAALKQVAAKYGVDPMAVAGVIKTESNWNPRNSTGSYNGLTQIGPQTFKEAGGQLGGMTYDQFKAASPAQQIGVYDAWLNHYGFKDQMGRLGIDTAKMPIERQAALLQGFQFSPNGMGFKTALSQGRLDVPATGTTQARALGDTSIGQMERYFKNSFGPDTSPAPPPVPQAIAQNGPFNQFPPVAMQAPLPVGPQQIAQRQTPTATASGYRLPPEAMQFTPPGPGSPSLARPPGAVDMPVANARPPIAPQGLADANDPMRSQLAPAGQSVADALGIAYQSAQPLIADRPKIEMPNYTGPSRVANFAPPLPLEYQGGNAAVADAGRFTQPGIGQSAAVADRGTPPPAPPGSPAQTMPSQRPADGPRRLADATDPLRREKAPMGLADMLQNPNKSLQNFGKAISNIGGKYASAAGAVAPMGDIAPQAPARTVQPQQTGGRMKRFKSAFPVEPQQT